MKEDFLHFVWRNKQFNFTELISEQNQKIEVVRFGDYMQVTGPDFFNAQLVIDNQLWAGNVEMHLKASDWYIHKHETDINYNNVILHVVWDYDVDVFRKDNSVIPVLNLSKYVNKKVLENYVKLQSLKSWIYCENQLNHVDDSIWNIWKEKLLIDRLEQKSKTIEALLKQTKNNWEETLFIFLTKNFGLNINGNAFQEIAQKTTYKVINKEQHNSLSLEALLFGVSGLLQTIKQDVYYTQLAKEFQYLKVKHKHVNSISEPIHFFKLRPDNFPTIRLSQLAQLLHYKQHMFTDLIQQTLSQQDIYKYFSVSVSEYWKTHYVFDKISKTSFKNLSTSFIDLLLLNTILPLRFVYLKNKGSDDFEDVFKVYRSIKSEKNAIIDKFAFFDIKAKNAFDSQALIHLKKNYCDKKKCLQCAIGINLLKK